MYCATDPSLVTRVAFLAATETPFFRRITTACSISPLASVKACLQSIIGAPVFSRRSFTCVAEIFTVVAPIIKIPSIKIPGRDVACYVSSSYLIVCRSRQEAFASNVPTENLTRAGRPARVRFPLGIIAGSFDDNCLGSNAKPLHGGFPSGFFPHPDRLQPLTRSLKPVKHLHQSACSR